MSQVAARKWLAKWNPREYMRPEPGDTARIREYLRMKYQRRLWYDDSADQVSFFFSFFSIFFAFSSSCA